MQSFDLLINKMIVLRLNQVVQGSIIMTVIVDVKALVLLLESMTAENTGVVTVILILVQLW